MAEDFNPALSAMSAIGAVLIDLAQYVQSGGEGCCSDLGLTEVVENICDAAKLTIEARGIPEGDDELAQVHAALCKFLEG